MIKVIANSAKIRITFPIANLPKSVRKTGQFSTARKDPRTTHPNSAFPKNRVSHRFSTAYATSTTDMYTATETFAASFQ